MNKRSIAFRCWDGKQMRPVEPIVYLQDYDGLSFTNSYQDYGELLRTEDVVLMQFTGLQDKNGVEIYEGDVLVGRYIIQNLTVVWDVALASFELSGNRGSEHLLDVSGPNDLGYNPWKVLGNIYENPDLLPVEEVT